MSERYKLTPIPLPHNPDAINLAMDTLSQSLPRSKDLHRSGNVLATRAQTRGALDALLELDRMGCTEDYRVAHMARNIGDEPFVRDTFEEILTQADNTSRSERVLELVRLGVVLELDTPPLAPRTSIIGRFFPTRSGLNPAEIASRTQEAEQAAQRFEALYDKHTAMIAARVAAPAAAPPPITPEPPISTPAPPPASEPEPAAVVEPAPPEPPKPTRWAPETRDGKSAEWLAAQDEASKLWEAAVLSKSLNLKDRKEPHNTLRYEAAMYILHSKILGENPPAPTQLRAMLDYFVPRIWTQPNRPELWFADKFKQYGKAIDLDGIQDVVKYTLIPLGLRKEKGPFNKEDLAKYRKLFLRLNMVTHPDRQNSHTDADPQYEDAANTVFKAISTSHALLEPLIDPEKKKNLELK